MSQAFCFFSPAPKALGGMALGLAMLALTACSAGTMGGSNGSDSVGPSGMASAGGVDLETQQACRQRVNEMYEVRNRGDVYASASTVNTPYSANYQAGITSHGLSGQFAYERSVAECERNATSGPEPTAAPPMPPPATGR